MPSFVKACATARATSSGPRGSGGIVGDLESESAAYLAAIQTRGQARAHLLGGSTRIPEPDACFGQGANRHRQCRCLPEALPWGERAQPVMVAVKLLGGSVLLHDSTSSRRQVVPVPFEDVPRAVPYNEHGQLTRERHLPGSLQDDPGLLDPLVAPGRP